MNCLKCGNPTNNLKFCSRACAASVNNKIPKRKRTRKCKLCDNFASKNRLHCEVCIDLHFTYQDISVGEALYTNGVRSNRYGLIRFRARHDAKKLGLLGACSCCGYSKHVEVCHIKGVAEFSLDTMLSVVNHKDNLLVLCPNCHWEFDHDPEFRKNTSSRS